MTSPKHAPGRHCPQCGAALRTDEPEETCLRCALAHALEGSDADVTAAGARPSPVSTPASPRFGDYDLLEEIARGGMGVVYKARQVSLDRIVAVKLLLFGPLASKEFVQRFRVEATAAASLQHPNIVRIHDVGVHHGQQFLTMDFVEGHTLARLAADKPLSVQRSAGYLRTIAEAIDYAHERGILHRDLKPSNVLIDANDQPRVTDFGLAKRFGVPPAGASHANASDVASPGDLTISGQVLGSPSYMPPEQAAPSRGKVARPSDVYSLGAILFYLLTGRPPFMGESLSQTLHQLLNSEPASPRLFQPGVPADLETICLKCLEKDPGKRYQSARALADELGRFQRGEPILARPVSRVETLVRWSRRNPKIAGLAGAIAVVVALGFTGVMWQWRRAEKGEAIAQRNLYASDMKVALQAWETGDLQRARVLLETHRPKRGREDLRGFEWRLLTALCQQRDEGVVLRGHAGSVQSVDISSDGKWVASGASDRSVKLWDTGTGKLWTTLARHQGTVHAVVFAPDGQTLASGARDNLVKLWDVRSHTEVGSFGGHIDAVRALAFSPDGRTLASSGEDGTIRFWDPTSPQNNVARPAGIKVEHLAFSPDGRWLAACGTDISVHLWNARSQQKEKKIGQHSAHVLVASFSPDSQVLASAGHDGTIKLWNIVTGESLGLVGWGPPVHALAFAPQQRMLAAATDDGLVRLWHSETKQLLATLRGHANNVRALAFSRDGNLLATGSEDHSVRLWNIPALSEDKTILRHASMVNSIAFTAKGDTLVSTEPNIDDWRTWSLHDRPNSVTMPGEKHGVWCIAAAPQERAAAMGGIDGSLRLWDLGTGRQLAWTQAHQGATEFVAFAPDGRTIATASRDATVKLWDRATLKPQATLRGHTGPVRCVAYSPDGAVVVSGGADGTVRLWDPRTFQSVAVLDGHAGDARALAFSPDGKTLASSGADRVIRLWDWKQRRSTHTFVGHTAMISSLAFSSDGTTLVSGSWDSTVKLWSLRVFQEVATLRAHSGQVTQVTFSPDGNTLASASADGTVRLWLAPTFAALGAKHE